MNERYEFELPGAHSWRGMCREWKYSVQWPTSAWRREGGSEGGSEAWSTLLGRPGEGMGRKRWPWVKGRRPGVAGTQAVECCWSRNFCLLLCWQQVRLASGWPAILVSPNPGLSTLHLDSPRQTSPVEHFIFLYLCGSKLAELRACLHFYLFEKQKSMLKMEYGEWGGTIFVSQKKTSRWSSHGSWYGELLQQLKTKGGTTKQSVPCAPEHGRQGHCWNGVLETLSLDIKCWKLI